MNNKKIMVTMNADEVAILTAALCCLDVLDNISDNEIERMVNAFIIAAANEKVKTIDDYVDKIRKLLKDFQIYLDAF